jgi:hypothetical protein
MVPIRVSDPSDATLNWPSVPVSDSCTYMNRPTETVSTGPAALRGHPGGVEQAERDCNFNGRIARGNLTPGFHRSVRNSLPLHGSCRPGHLAAGFTQAQCAKYCGFAAAASASFLMAFVQELCFLYLLMIQRSR